MSSSVSAPAPRDPARERRRARWQALALFAIAALPVAAAFIAYFFWTPQRGVNYGELLEPRPVPDAALTGADGKPWRLSSLRGKWVLLQIDSGRCEEACVKRLFAMRQARLLQGREMERVERVWLIDDDAVPDARLLKAYEGMHVARGGNAVAGQLPPGPPGPRIFVVDPLGNLMMRFPQDPDPIRMYRDLARLLQVSHIG